MMKVLRAFIIFCLFSVRAVQAQTVDVSPVTKDNIRYSSHLFTRKAYVTGTMGRQGLSLGVDIAGVKVPSKFDNSVINKSVQSYIVLPMPMLNIDYSDKGYFSSLGFIVAATSSIKGVSLSYLNVRYHYALPIDAKKETMVGISILYSSLKALREINLANQPITQQFGMSSFGGELLLNLGLGGSHAKAESLFATRIHLGMNSINSAFSSTPLNEYFNYAASPAYGGLGIGLNSASRGFALALDAYFDGVIGFTPVAIFSFRL